MLFLILPYLPRNLHAFSIEFEKFGVDAVYLLSKILEVLGVAMLIAHHK